MSPREMHTEGTFIPKNGTSLTYFRLPRHTTGGAATTKHSKPFWSRALVSSALATITKGRPSNTRVAPAAAYPAELATGGPLLSWK